MDTWGPVGFINPGSLGDRLLRQGSSQESKNKQGKGAVQHPTRRPGPRRATPARRLLQPTYPTGALDSGSSRLRTASPIGRPAPSPTSDTDPASLRLGLVGTLLTTLLRPAHSEPTGAIRPGAPRSEGTRRRVEKGKARLTSQNHYTRDHTLHGTVLCSHPDTNSIVGVDISLYSIVGVAKTPIR